MDVAPVSYYMWQLPILSRANMNLHEQEATVDNAPQPLRPLQKNKTKTKHVNVAVLRQIRLLSLLDTWLTSHKNYGDKICF